MRQPLLIAVLGALAGFGGWIWLTGPGTSVPNALLALLCAVLCGRAAWWLALRGTTDDDAPPRPDEAAPAAAEAPAATPPAAPRPGQRMPPPVDAEPWRRPERGP